MMSIGYLKTPRQMKQTIIRTLTKDTQPAVLWMFALIPVGPFSIPSKFTCKSPNKKSNPFYRNNKSKKDQNDCRQRSPCLSQHNRNYCEEVCQCRHAAIADVALSWSIWRPRELRRTGPAK